MVLETDAVENAEPRANRLAGELSPYLLQHKDNPVHWLPWSEEAFTIARQSDRPVFLSIGYATCHWCHVMERESFEDETVAELMNQSFVNIKVDREERPDIDQVYMNVCQMMTGSGGWPLTIIMTPDKQPFFAATYLPKENRFGRMGMLDLIPRISEAWQNERGKIEESAASILEHLQSSNADSSQHVLGREVIDQAAAQFLHRFDSTWGGFGVAPKFPSAHNLIFLLRHQRHSGDTQTRQAVEKTLRAMRRGGMYDHIGFGFHRYSTDREWLVPHFEKMLYDQAMLMLAYSEAHRAIGTDEYARVVREIADYVDREMTSPDGAFFSAEDADSEGEEGKYYVWKLAELAGILNQSELELARDRFNLSDEGNFEDEATGIRTGANIPHLSLDDQLGGDTLERIRAKMLAARHERVHPLKDDKILTDWNGLMIAALARAGRSLDADSLIEGAARAATFINEKMRTEGGELLHRHRAGETGVDGFLDDYSFMVWAWLELYAATLDAAYLELARDDCDRCLDQFLDAESNALYFTSQAAEQLLVRPREVYDGAIPSGTSVMVSNLLRLAHLTGNTTYRDRAKSIADTWARQVAQAPSAHAHLLTAVQAATTPSLEVVIVGARESEDTRRLIEAARSAYHPDLALLLIEPGKDGDAARRLAPFTEQHAQIDGQATAYVCRDFSCQAPTTDPEVVKEILSEVGAND